MSSNHGTRAGILRRQDGDPTFDEAWQARLMGLISALTSDQAAISRTEWASALGIALKTADSKAESEEARVYYDHVLSQVQALLSEKEILSGCEIGNRVDLWKTAYQRTPHGAPVLLDSASEEVAK